MPRLLGGESVSRDGQRKRIFIRCRDLALIVQEGLGIAGGSLRVGHSE
jgi:hypothetical protein